MYVYEHALIEKAGAAANVDEKFQFLRQGYFRVDEDSAAGALVFNQIVGLKDSYAKA
jgi:glutaminyl-tRNA synthetase